MSSDAYIDREILEQTDRIIDLDLLKTKSFSLKDLEEQEERHLSELYRVANNMDEKELCICVATALEKFPEMVFRTAFYFATLRKGEKNK